MNILCFVEDPGAVNFLAPLISTFQYQEWQFLVASDGHATQLLGEKGFSSFIIKKAQDIDDLFAKNKFSLLLVGTSENLNSFGLMFITAVKKIGIPSIGFVDFFANSAFRFKGNSEHPLTYAPDWLLVPDEWTREAYRALDFPDTRIFVSGHPHDDYLLQQKKKFEVRGAEALRSELFPGLRTTQCLIIFASELSTGLNADQYQRTDEYTLYGRGTSTLRTEIVLEEFLDAIELLVLEGMPKPYLVLRCHPKETVAELSDYCEKFDWISHGGTPLPLLYVADAVVGMSSMLLSEAYSLGTETFSILPREIEQNWLPLIRLGYIECAMRKGQIQDKLRNLLNLETEDFGIREKKGVDIKTVDRIIKFLIGRFIVAHSEEHKNKVGILE